MTQGTSDSNPAPSEDDEQLFAGLLALSEDPPRREYLRDNPRLLDRAVLDRLLAEAVRQVGIDLQQAERLSATAPIVGRGDQR